MSLKLRVFWLMAGLVLAFAPNGLELKAQEAQEAQEQEKAKDTESPATAPAPAADAPESLSFMKDVAPVLAKNCVACHNAKKTEGRYDMTTFDKLVKGGPMSDGASFVAGKPEDSLFTELIQPDAEPRMPFKLDPLSSEQIALIDGWIKQGGKFDGADPNADWTIELRKNRVVNIPETYPAAMPVTALAFSPDGSMIVSSGYHELNFWKTEDGSLGPRLRPLAERTYEIAYSADGKWLATASGNPGQSGSVKLWSAGPNGEAKFEKDLLDASDSVLAVAFSPDSKQLAAGGADRTIRIWEIESGKEVLSIEDHADWVLDVAFSPDGQRLASASRDKTSKVFDVVKKESLATFPGHAETVFAVEFVSEGKMVASAGGDSKIRVWDPNADAKEARSMGASGPIFRLAVTPDRKMLIACGQDKVARIFNPEDGKSVRNLEGHKDFLYACAVSPDGAKVIAGGYDGEVRIWNLADGKLIKAFLAAPGLTLKQD